MNLKFDIDKIFITLKSLNQSVPTPPSLQTQKDIDEKEKKYKIAFPPSYKEYLLKYSDLVVGNFEMFRMNEPKWPYLDLDCNVNDARKIGLPELYFPFLQNNSDYFCFDLSTEGPEYQVVFWSHDGLIKLDRWSCFLDWVLNCWIKEATDDN
jgi:hypothetical protein